MTRSISIEVGVGEIGADGKTSYPNYVLVILDRKDAFQVAQSILGQLERDDEAPVMLPLSGTCVEEPE